MTVGAIISLLIALAKAFPLAADYIEKIVTALNKWNTDRNNKEALERLEAKNNSVDTAIDAHKRVRRPSAQQRRKTAEKKRLSGSG